MIGTGHGEKRQIAAMIGFLLPKADPASADAADALAIAITHAIIGKARALVGGRCGGDALRLSANFLQPAKSLFLWGGDRGGGIHYRNPLHSCWDSPSSLALPHKGRT